MPKKPASDEILQGRRQRAASAFFGRRKAKPLSPAQQVLYDRLLPSLRIDLDTRAADDLAAIFDHKPATIRLEIGFGGGEHLAHEAERFPLTGFIGAEVFINGVARMLQHVAQRGLTNIRLHDEDAIALLDWLPPGCLQRIDLLYPDPWPKKRHWKRRFVSAANLDRFARVLKTGGEFRFASDIGDYVEWTLDLCAQHAAFGAPENVGRAVGMAWDGWMQTRYEAKAVREGRNSQYLSFIKQ